MDKLRVLLADDHPLMLAGIRGALEKEKDIEVVGEATSGAQVLPLVGHTSADVVLLDLRLPDVDGLTCLEWIHQQYPAVKVIMLSVSAEQSEITSALERGASAYVVKSIDPADLAAAIRHTISGAFFCLGGIAHREPSSNGIGAGNGNEAGLSERQIEILQAVTRGLSNRAIANELWLSDQTVKFHLHNIYRKLGVSNRTEAAKYAFDHGLSEAPT
jgi:DNA-binding NarL/FixJ family response regulator